MRCERARTLASADVDGELADADRADLDRHLDGCPACSAWTSRARDLRRTMLVRPVGDQHDVTEAVLARANVPTVGATGWVRALLAYLGVALLILNLPLLLTGDEAGATEHVGRHLGASGVALAVGFLYVAWRPERAIGLVPLAAALGVGLTISAVVDFADGAAVTAEATHVFELVGLVCLWAISGGHHRLARRLAALRPAPGQSGLSSVGR
ncbi:MAG: zf-HC2 domain-containing protein [Actinomycetota bacterium]